MPCRALENVRVVAVAAQTLRESANCAPSSGDGGLLARGHRARHWSCTGRLTMDLARIGRLFPRSTVVETAATTMSFEAPREEVWRAMMFYEEVPARPAALLRLFLPLPLRTRGDKTRAGERIDCTYDGGSLVKTMTGVDRPRSITFDVQTQALGIEDAITMTGGSYELTEQDGVTRVVLTTRYYGHMRPRWLFAPLERYLARRLHHHILEGMREVVAARSPDLSTVPVELPR